MSEISEIKVGEFGITRDGRKAELIDRTEYNQEWKFSSGLSYETILTDKNGIVSDIYESKLDIISKFVEVEIKNEVENIKVGEFGKTKSGKKAKLLLNVDLEDSVSFNKRFWIAGKEVYGTGEDGRHISGDCRTIISKWEDIDDMNEVESIKIGEFGITRDGRKVELIYYNDSLQKHHVKLWVNIDGYNEINSITTSPKGFYISKYHEVDEDVIGRWKE